MAVVLMLRLLLFLLATLPSSRSAVIDYVDGFIGSTYSEQSLELGNTIPQLGTLFSHSPLSPDTTATENKCVAPYYYHDEFWKGLRKTHWMSGSCVLEYGSMTVIPSISLDIPSALTYHSLNHSLEEWTPSHYKVYLPESKVDVEATNDNRAGIIKFNLENMSSQFSSFYIIVMSFDTTYNESSVNGVSSEEMFISNPVHRFYQGSGKSAGFSGHHFLKLSQAAKSYGLIHGYSDVEHGHDNERMHGSSSERGPVAAFFEFDRSAVEEVSVAIGSSFVSREKAKKNLISELTGGLFNVSDVVERVSRVWNEKLSRIEVLTPVAERRGSEMDPLVLSNLRQFYTALWHSMLLPRLYSDHDGEYLSFSGGETVEQSQQEGYSYYDDFSMWDTFRATSPLQMLVLPEVILDFVKSLVAKADQGGWLPMFPAWNSYTQEMIGDNCVTFLGDAYQKGFLDGDDGLARKVYSYMRRNALEVPPLEEYLQGKGRRAIESYLMLGFVPLEVTVPLAFHSNEQVSRTLEYAYNDYVVAQLARDLGFASDYDTLMESSQGFRKVIDSEGVGFPRGRYLNLSWSENEATFDPDYKYSWLTEASPYQYAWFVPHQVEQLVDLYGGRDGFSEKLVTFFEENHYNHGNEPDHQALFLFAYLKNSTNGAWRIQQFLPTITSSFYSDSPGGLAGNDDAGQISSWFVMTSLGLYQVCPGCGGSSEYVLTAPMFDEATLHIQREEEPKRSFTISARRSSASDIYIQSASLNGADYDCAFLPHEQISRGGSLVFELGHAPNKTWGSQGRDCLTKYFGKL